MDKSGPRPLFFPMDDTGNVLNPAAIFKVQAPWKSVLEPMIQAFQLHEGDSLHSIYLRGSVASGHAVPGISDIDTFALVKNQGVRWESPPWTIDLQQQCENILGFPVEVEGMLASYDNNFATQRPFLSMVMKTQSLCLWGDDLIPSLPVYKPGKAMMIDSRWYAQDLQNFLGEIRSTSVVIPNWVRAFMKLTIRVGFERVMERMGKYTRDLRLCVDSFSQYYPEKETEMRQALDWFLSPPKDKKKILNWAEGFGIWLRNHT